MKGQRYSSFFKSWERVLGKGLAGNIKLIDIKKDTLLVSASHPGWMQMVCMKKDKLLSLLNKLYPELAIKRIKISLGAVNMKNEQSATQVTKKDDSVENDPALEIDLKKELKTLDNSKLKDVLKRFYTSICKRR